MSGKASTDFGLFKEKFTENQIKSNKSIFIVIGLILVFFMIIYLFIHLSKQIFIKNHDNYTEKLINLPLLPSKPFEITYNGNRPSQFIPTTTMKITTLNYPQLNNYRHRYYPNNIQDIIDYISRINQTTNHQNKISDKKIGSSLIDRFYPYKPQNPSDVNLLAPNNLRFAPPIWRNIKTTTILPPLLPPPLLPPRIYHHPHSDNTNKKEVYQFSNNNDPNRPLFVTVNVYPNDLQQQQKYNNYHRIENNDNKNDKGMKVKFIEPNKMVIFLNLYPDHQINKIK